MIFNPSYYLALTFEEIVKVMKEYVYEIKQPKGGSSHYSFLKLDVVVL